MFNIKRYLHNINRLSLYIKYIEIYCLCLLYKILEFLKYFNDIIQNLLC